MEKMPPSVKLAVYLLFTLVVLYVTQFLYVWPRLPETPPLDAFIGVGVAFAFFLFIIWGITKGRNWARWIYLVLFVLGASSDVLTLSVQFAKSIVLGSLSVAELLVQAVVAALLFLPGSSAWFRGKASAKLRKATEDGCKMANTAIDQSSRSGTAQGDR